MTNAHGSEGVSTGLALNVCHPERRLAKSEAICRTESKDPCHSDITGGDAGNFRMVVRFFDDDDCEILYDPSRQAAAQESRAWKCRATAMRPTDSRREATPA